MQSREMALAGEYPEFGGKNERGKHQKNSFCTTGFIELARHI
jgi:hypothetical protein